MLGQAIAFDPGTTGTSYRGFVGLDLVHRFPSGGSFTGSAEVAACSDGSTTATAHLGYQHSF